MCKINWTKVLGLFVLGSFFLLITFRDSELWAQECVEPDPVPKCTKNDPSCQQCGSALFCCPNEGGSPACAGTYDGVCAGDCAGANQGKICQVRVCEKPQIVPLCSDEEMTREPCSGCARGSFCCPLTGACDSTYDGLCNGSVCKGFEQDSICQVPPTPPRRETRNITFINHCDETIWVAGSNKGLVGGQKTPILGEITGFELPMHTGCSGDSDCTSINPAYRCDTGKGFCVDMNDNDISIHTIQVPGNLDSANFWPRTACNFPCNSAPCCKTGDCASADHGFGIQCNGGTKGPPANSFEATFNFSDAHASPNDFYDLTNVDGWVLGIQIKQMNGVELWQNPTKKDPNSNPPGKEIPAPELNCGGSSCNTFNMIQCPPELKQRITETGRDVCWSIGLAASNKAQRDRDTLGILAGIASDCEKLALHACSCSAISTGGMSCGNAGAGGCALGDSAFCCSPFNDQLPGGHGGVCCEDLNDPLYIKPNPCNGKQWETPDTVIAGRNWCNDAGIPQRECSYAKIFSRQCPGAYSWQFNDQESTFQCINPDYEVTFCPGTNLTDHDNDGLPGNSDLDSDGDGIPDDFESSFNNEDLTMIPNSNDGTRNAIDSSFNNENVTMNSTSRNGENGENPNLYERDGDGIPHQYDLDSDGDGIPDHGECGGENDSDRDGLSDNHVDSDGDGLHDEHDEDHVGNVLECPDTDGDGVPDFLDTDSDDDGVADANETIGGMDVDGDGIHDDSEDLNGDGLADSVHPDTGDPHTLVDSDGDGIFDHLDSSDDTSGVRGGGGCSSIASASVGSTPSLAVYLLIPVFILFRRVVRKYR